MTLHDSGHAATGGPDFASAVFETTDALLVLLDREGRIVHFNPACERISGFRREEVEGRRLWDTLVPPERVSEIKHLFQEVVDDPDARNDGEHLWLTKLGDRVPIRWTDSKILDADGAVEYVLCTGIDLGEQHAALRALRESEERFRTAFDLAPVGMTLSAPDFSRQRVNRAFCEMLGYTEEELLSTTFETITHPDDLERSMALARRINSGQTNSFWVEKRYLHKDGHDVWVIVSAALVRDPGGRPACVIAHVQDITKRKRAEEALRESEERFRSAFHFAPFGMSLTALDGQWLMVNPALCDLLGYAEEELLATRYQSLTHPDDLEENEERARRLRIGEIDALQLEKRYLHRDGHEVWALVSGSLVRDANGRPAYTVTQIQDITTRKQAEEALQETTAVLSALVEASPAAIVSVDRNGLVTRWNWTAERMFGWTEDEVIGRFWPLVDDTTRAEFLHTLSRTMHGEIVANAEIRRRRKDGAPIDLSASAAPLRNSNGEIVEMVGVISDFTERNQLREQLLQAQRLESIGRLAGGIAHDFNNILTAISGYTEFLLADLGLGDPRRESAEQIGKATERASALVKKLLAFSRRQLLQPRVLSVNSIVAELEPMLRRLMGEDIELQTAPDPARGTVKADLTAIEQMIVNLVVNARDAMPAGGVLEIDATSVELDTAKAALLEIPPGPYVMLRVTDDGTGMDEETRSHIFEPFFTTKEPGKGTGLGLSTAYGLVAQSGGAIEVESEPAVGTTMRVYLPKVDEEPEAIGPPSGVVPMVRGSETILLVEDEEAVRDFACRILRDGGYTVLLAGGSPDAIAVAEEYRESIHLLLTDVVLPGMSGRELADHLCAQRPQMHVLYASGYPDDAVLQHGLSERGASYIGKPFSGEMLLRSVRQALENGGSKPSTARPA